jgi:hypothetical protein
MTETFKQKIRTVHLKRDYMYVLGEFLKKIPSNYYTKKATREEREEGQESLLTFFVSCFPLGWWLLVFL